MVCWYGAIHCVQFLMEIEIRFCEIAYMFEREEQIKHKNGLKTVLRKYFHARWLQHGSQMLLQETAHPNGLFFLNECDDLPIECIYKRCGLHILQPGEPEPMDEPGDNFFSWCVPIIHLLHAMLHLFTAG